MNIYYLIVTFIMGTLLGSFFNVVGYRLPLNQSLVKPRSRCPKCNHQLSWYELIPILSYIIQLGKCRNCHTKIALFYPFVELITGLLFAISYYMYGLSNEFFMLILIISFMMIVIVSDVNFLIIPDEVTITFSCLALVLVLVTEGFISCGRSLISGAFLFLFMYLTMIIGNKLLKKECLGGGDIKLMFFIGVLISPLSGLFSIFIASMIALPISLILYLKNPNNVIPFGPFLLVGAFIMVLFKIDLSIILNIV